jgi:hypothetical protein
VDPKLQEDRQIIVYAIVRCVQKHLRGLLLLRNQYDYPLRSVAEKAALTEFQHFIEERHAVIFSSANKLTIFHNFFSRDLETAYVFKFIAINCMLTCWLFASVIKFEETGSLQGIGVAFIEHVSAT